MEEALAKIASEGIVFLAMKFPVMFTIFSVVGMLRFVFKPITAVVDNIVAETESKDDDVKWNAFKQSKAFKAIAWVVDLFASIKLVKPVKK